MSLVEQALKKLRESRPAGTPQSPPLHPHAAGVPAMPTPAPSPQYAPVLRSSRIVNIDRAALRAAEVIPSVEQERQLGHDYRQLKRPLLANAFGRGVPAMASGRALMVASALPGDGKTFTSINLAMSIALEKDVSVLLVDADVAKPHVSRLLNILEEPGLLDVLRDDNLDVESTILNTDVPNLYVLPAGRNADTATELLASVRMQSVVAQLCARDPNRVVLFDSPPLLLTSESRVLATHVGQVVVVVRADVTPQQAVLDALQLLPENRFVGLVLNQDDESMHGGYQQYYGQREDSSA
jgi:protein-tyrosine kinase